MPLDRFDYGQIIYDQKIIKINVTIDWCKKHTFFNTVVWKHENR
jgi:hypothetical protein